MNEQVFYYTLIKKLIAKFNPELKISENIYSYRFKVNDIGYILQYNRIYGNWTLESELHYYTGWDYVAKKLANLLGYE
jgi:hypothetical protein